MALLSRRFQSRKTKKSRQEHGMVLLIVVFLLGVAATGFLVSALNKASSFNDRDIRANQALASAKEALLSSVLGANNTGQRPGDLIRPDVTADADYNGTAETGCLDANQANGVPLVGAGANMRCLGRLPWKDLGLTVESPSENDPDGAMPWYAVSANLVDPVCLLNANPGITNLPYTGYACGSSTALPHSWLTVRDSYGNILSNRVAAVILIPGSPVGNQTRPTPPNLARADQYLDSVTVLGTCDASPFVAGTYSNADMDNDFIKGYDAHTVSSSSPCFGSNYKFNDKLVYITVDELVREATKRAAAEADAVLTKYNAANPANPRFPYAAPLGSAIGSFNASGTSNSGMIPLNVTDSCTCASSTSCSCGFSRVGSISFTRSGTATWSSTNITGACTRETTQKCSCTGAGACKNTSGSRNFTCTATGNCTHNTTGTYTITPSSYGTISSASGGCSISGSNASCNNAGSFTIGLKMASWFNANQWQNYFYYRWSSASDLQVGSAGGIGTRLNIQAILIGTGAPIVSAPYAIKGAAQTGVTSTNLNDYLDSTENTDGDTEFESSNKVFSSSYNDQVFVVTP